MSSTTVAYDLPSGLPLCHLSFLLDKLLPGWYIRTVFTRIYRGSLATVTRSELQRNPAVYPDLVFAGSLAELLLVPDRRPREPGAVARDEDAADREAIAGRAYDLDVLLLMRDLVAVQDRALSSGYVIDTSHTRPGYFRLLNDSSGEYLPAATMVDRLKEKMDALGLSYTRAGPAYTELRQDTYLDRVCTGFCASWPPEAGAWVTRDSASGWPTAEMRRDIVANNCHFVAKAHQLSDDPELEFRYSFVVATKELLDTIRSEQRQCYILFKMLVKYALKSDMAFSTYCLKTIFLWTLEKIPLGQWTDPWTGLGTCFLELLDSLIRGIVEHNIPEYFIQENNLIGHIPRDELKPNIRKLTELRRNPLEFMLEHDDKYIIPCLLHFPLSDVFQQIVQHAKDTRQTRQTVLEMHLDSNMRYFMECANGQLIYGTIGSMEAIAQNRKMLGHVAPASQPSDFIDEFLASDDLISFGKRKEGEVKGFLATIKSIMFFDQKTVKKQREIGLAFEEALRHPAISSTTHLGYAVFLLVSGQLDKCVSTSRAGLSLRNRQHFPVLEYVMATSQHLDDVIQHLVVTRVYLEVPANIMLHYLLVGGLLSLGRTGDANSHMAEFLSACDESSAQHGVAVSQCYLLLAYSFMRLGRFWEAGDSFVKDRTLGTSFDKGNTLKMWICRAIAVYNWVMCKP